MSMSRCIVNVEERRRCRGVSSSTMSRSKVASRNNHENHSNANPPLIVDFRTIITPGSLNERKGQQVTTKQTIGWLRERQKRPRIALNKLHSISAETTRTSISEESARRVPSFRGRGLIEQVNEAKERVPLTTISVVASNALQHDSTLFNTFQHNSTPGFNRFNTIQQIQHIQHYSTQFNTFQHISTIGFNTFQQIQHFQQMTISNG